MRSGLLSPLTRKVTLALTLRFTVLLWNDGNGKQLSVSGKQHSRLRVIRKGVAQSIALQFSCKICLLDLFHKCGDTFADVFRKIKLCSAF